MSLVDEDFIFREDTWLCMIRQSHELFCNCDSFTGHLRKLLDFQHPEWRMPTEGETTTTDAEVPDGGPGGEEPTDEELLGALADVEGGGEAENMSR